MTGPIITITKRLAARQEIEGAIRLLSQHRNYVAAELLGSAAIDVIAGVAKIDRVETMSVLFDDLIKDDKKAEVRRLMRHPYNFLKHSDRDAGSAIDRYDSAAALWRVFQAILDYEACWKARTFTMLLFTSWFLSRVPEISTEEAKDATVSFSKAFGDVKNVSQKSALDVLEKAFKQFDQLGDEIVNLPAFSSAGHMER